MGGALRQPQNFVLTAKDYQKPELSPVWASTKVFEKKSRDDDKCVAPANPRKLPGEEMVTSIYRILTIGRWESLNFMKYKTRPLRPVHGRLALRFLEWVVKRQDLEFTQITYLYCITVHILVRARMYDCARSILMNLLGRCSISSSVFSALMDTYCMCNSNPGVFDLLIRVYVRKGATKDALNIFRLMGFRGFLASVFTCNMILAAMAKKAAG